MMQVKYARSRGVAVEGADVTCSKDWLIETLVNNHAATKAYIDSIGEDNLSEVLEVFGGDNVFESSNAAQDWIQENADDEDALDEIVNQLKAKLGAE